MCRNKCMVPVYRTAGFINFNKCSFVVFDFNYFGFNFIFCGSFSTTVLRSFFASSIVILLPKISTTTTRVSAMLLGSFYRGSFSFSEFLRLH